MRADAVLAGPGSLRSDLLRGGAKQSAGGTYAPFRYPFVSKNQHSIVHRAMLSASKPP